VVIDDLDIHRTFVSPDKTYPPLLVDPDAVLAMTIAAQSFEHVPWRRPQVSKFNCCIQHSQFTFSHYRNVDEARDTLTFEQVLGI
jgi:hypothetical protein